MNIISVKFCLNLIMDVLSLINFSSLLNMGVLGRPMIFAQLKQGLFITDMKTTTFA